MSNKQPGRPRSEEDPQLIANSKALFHHLDERTQHITLAVDNVLDRYINERHRLAQELHAQIKEAYWHSGLYFRVQRRPLEDRRYFSYDLLWAKGKVVLNDPTFRPNTDIDIKFTDKIHRCDESENGKYTLSNLKSACPGKADFEHRLAYEYEKVLRPLRKDLKRTSQLIKAIINFGYIPEIDDLLDAMPEFDIRKSLTKMKKKKR